MIGDSPASDARTMPPAPYEQTATSRGPLPQPGNDVMAVTWINAVLRHVRRISTLT
jgi:hypothetical protein